MYRVDYINGLPRTISYDEEGEYTYEQAESLVKYGTTTPAESDIQALEEETQNLKVSAEAKRNLADTDWYVTRLTETGKAIPEEVLANRQAWRELIG